MKDSVKVLLGLSALLLTLSWSGMAQAKEPVDVQSRLMRLRVMDTALEHMDGQTAQPTSATTPIIISNPVPVIKPVYTASASTSAPAGVPGWAYLGLLGLIGSIGALFAFYRFQEQRGASKLAEAIQAQGIAGTANMPKDWAGIQKLILSMEQEYSETCERNYALELKVSHQKDIIGKSTHERDIWMKKTQIAQDRWKKAERILNVEREQRQAQESLFKHDLETKTQALEASKSEFQKALGISAKQLHVEHKKAKHLEEQLKGLNERLNSQQERHTQLTEKIKRLNAYNVTAAERLASEKEQRGQVAKQFERACNERDLAEKRIKELLQNIKEIKSQLKISEKSVAELKEGAVEQMNTETLVALENAVKDRDQANWYLGEERALRAELEQQLEEERGLREHIQRQMVSFGVETVLEGIPNDWPGSERRTQQRIEVPETMSSKVKISAKDASGKFLRGKLKDVGPNGARAFLPADRIKQDSLGLKLSLPGRRRAISTNGTVVWRGQEQNGLVDVGLAFEELDNADQEHLESFLTS